MHHFKFIGFVFLIALVAIWASNKISLVSSVTGKG
jgi:hypothetical protein